ncbi:hypothetical protein [Acetobacterium malicum]|uniref:hypothetical protein n=1 Tax=Acetobacterium malicum TaxID=52692 RepID=UPI00047AA310|nr:hypothetical protein [Acetobacterium dehalogenans]
MNKKMIKVGLMIGYLCFFVVMDFWVISIQNSFNPLELRSDIFHYSRFWGMMLINYLKWFMLGFLLHSISKSEKLRFKVDLIYLAIALICAAIYFMINFCILVPLPVIYSGKFMTQLICLMPILSGFFMFESLFSGRPSANTDQ